LLKAVLDTHALIWYIYDDNRLSSFARQTIKEIENDGDTIAFSSISLAEIVYLSEKGRIDPQTLNRLLTEVDKENALLIEIPFERKIAETMQDVERADVPDLPDRIIAATALYLGVSVISRDRKIRLSKIDTIW
jgi:PIN domain nuclease of toxin-antitoxin system